MLGAHRQQAQSGICLRAERSARHRRSRSRRLARKGLSSDRAPRFDLKATTVLKAIVLLSTDSPPIVLPTKG